MSVELVAIGDCHFGPQGGRNAERYRAFDQIVSEGLALERLGAWLVLGDVFHAKSSIEDRNAVAARLQRMAARAPVVAVRGNHDAPNDLDIFGRLGAAYPIRVVARPTVVSLDLATGDHAEIAVVPYPDKGGLVAQEMTREDGLDALLAIVFDLARQLSNARVEGALTLSAAHINIGGAVTSVGQTMIGGELELDPLMIQTLAELGPVLCGHIHKPQLIHGAHYAGSITAQDFGEVEAKRYLVVEAEHAVTGWEHKIISQC